MTFKVRFSVLVCCQVLREIRWIRYVRFPPNIYGIVKDPDTCCLVLGTQCLPPIPHTWYEVLGTKQQVPSTWHTTLCNKYLVPSSCYCNQVLGTMYLVPCTWYRASTNHLVHSAWYKTLKYSSQSIPSAWYQVPPRPI